MHSKPVNSENVDSQKTSAPEEFKTPLARTARKESGRTALINLSNQRTNATASRTGFASRHNEGSAKLNSRGQRQLRSNWDTPHPSITAGWRKSNRSRHSISFKKTPARHRQVQKRSLEERNEKEWNASIDKPPRPEVNEASDSSQHTGRYVRNGVEIEYSIGDPVCPVLGHSSSFLDALKRRDCGEEEDEFEILCPASTRLDALLRTSRLRPCLRTIPEEEDIAFSEDVHSLFCDPAKLFSEEEEKAVRHDDGFEADIELKKLFEAIPSADTGGDEDKA